MTLRWIISIILSLFLHTAILYGMYLQQSQNPSPPEPMEVEFAQPQEPVEQEPAMQENTEPEQDTDDSELIDDELKFRPVEENIESDTQPDSQPQDKEKEQNDTTEQQTDLAETEDSPEQLHSDEAVQSDDPPLTPAEYKEQIKQYRDQLLDDFDVSWQRVPQLKTQIPDRSMISDIDRHFQIKIIAYGFVDNKPAPPFLIWQPHEQTYTKTDEFDFSGFSNRIKDRSFDPVLQDALKQARREYGLQSLLRVIGLVPIETDRYFAAKQYQAVRSAGVDLDQVALTTGHYEQNKSGGFSLIIDSVTTVDNRTISVQDKEKTYSNHSQR